MPHPGCESKKVAHFLDERIPEWRIFESVQPVFASNLQWKLKQRRGGAVDSDAWAVDSENKLDFFRFEMKRLPDAAPEKDLSCEVFDNCLETLCDLLDLLERLVQDRILSAANAHGLEREANNRAMNTGRDDQASKETPAKWSSVGFIFSWLSDIVYPQTPENLPELPIGTTASMGHFSPVPDSIADSSLLRNAATENAQCYSKLQALGEIIAAALQSGADVTESCAVYLHLEQTTEEYDNIMDKLYPFNTCLESSDVSGGFKQLDLSYPLDIPRTRWKDFEPSMVSNRLLDVLYKKVSGCQGIQGQHHQVVLRLNGFQLEDYPLVFDGFLTCGHFDYWQESRFMPRTNPQGVQKFAPRPSFVHNLCGHIDVHRKQVSNPTVLNISFDESKLFATTADLLAHSGASPAMSLEGLLRRGFFRKPTAGGAFSPGDKAILALSLARCLLHLFQSPWIERPWTAESVQFLHRSTPTEVLDVHHPYISSSLSPNKGVEHMEPKAVKYQRIMLSFARLLLEIEMGETIAVDFSMSADLADVKNALLDVLESQEEPQGPYHQAIEGCLKFKALLTSTQKREPKAHPDFQIRKVIYTNVIEHLEQNLSRFRNHKRLLVRRNLRIEDRSIGPAPLISKSQIPGRSESLDSPRKLSTQQSLLPLSKPFVGGQPLILPTQCQQLKPDALQLHRVSLGDEQPVAHVEHPVVSNGRSLGPVRPSKRHDFEIAIICALRLEYDAVAHLFDEFWDEEGDPYGKAPGDQNTYTTGRIGKFDVVLVLLPAMGKTSAASAAANFRSSYTGVQLALLVGICGGVPKDNNTGKEILLGDVVISEHIVQYDFGRLLPNGFRRKDTPQETPGRASANVRSFIATLQTQLHLERLQSRTACHLVTIQRKNQGGKFIYPGTTEDKLFEPSYRHKHHSLFNCDTCNKHTQASSPVCEEALTSLCSELHCDETRLVQRRRLELSKETNRLGKADLQGPAIHFGSIASGDTVMKSGEDRDKIAEREKVIAFEMEGAGIWDNLSCIIIKGVCDYADSHKNKKWQNFASATAASATKALLERYHKHDVV
ncbi:hypothetical protein TWF718_006233 [Orbilia javanica]|uniref:Nucleoside phosphorylase domain-containing protein n=1 Tax=Orbilia javanica TaxID=47235 RepID=A0AAN8MT56_9PEZI